MKIEGPRQFAVGNDPPGKAKGLEKHAAKELEKPGKRPSARA